MQCPKCGAELPAKAKFCLECGSNISAVSGMETDISLGEMRTIAPENETDKIRDLSLGEMKTLTGLSGGLSQGIDGTNLAERYELIEKIGAGGFAEVWKAKDKKLGRIVAVKRLVADDGQSIERFRREAQLIAGLNHRNIVSVYDIGSCSDGLWIAMEYVEGGTLREYLKSKKMLEIPDALSLMRGIVQGLAYAHRKNLVHRDIKPANILLQQDGEDRVPKIVDFGLARAGSDSELSMTGYGMGTPYYMPPEQRRDAKSVNHTADIYALGKTLYEMVTGEIPDNVDPEKIPAPRKLSEIIFRCIKTRPEERYFSAEDLLRDLESIGGGVASAHGNQQGGQRDETACPQCGMVNLKDAKFCESCGSGLTRNCPGCKRENPISTRFCPSCGMDIETFEAAGAVLERMRGYANEKKWSRVCKEFKTLDANIRLSGTKGTELQKAFKLLNQEAEDAVAQRDRLSGLIREATECEDGAEKALALIEEYKTIDPHRDWQDQVTALTSEMDEWDFKRAEEQSSVEYGRAARRIEDFGCEIQEYEAYLQKHPDGKYVSRAREQLVRLKAQLAEAEDGAAFQKTKSNYERLLQGGNFREAESVCMEYEAKYTLYRIEIQRMKKKAAELDQERQRQEQLRLEKKLRRVKNGVLYCIAVAVLAVAGRSAEAGWQVFRFERAVAQKDYDTSRAVAKRLIWFYNEHTAQQKIEAVRTFFDARDSYNRLVGDKQNELAHYGGEQWRDAQKTVAEAEQPGDPVKGSGLYRVASSSVRVIIEKFKPAIEARRTYEARRATCQDSYFEKYEPALWRRMQTLQQAADAERDAKQAAKNYQSALSSLNTLIASAQEREAAEKKMLAAQTLCTKQKGGVDAALAEKHLSIDWKTALNLMTQANAVPDESTLYENKQAAYENAGQAFDRIGRRLQAMTAAQKLFEQTQSLYAKEFAEVEKLAPKQWSSFTEIRSKAEQAMNPEERIKLYRQAEGLLEKAVDARDAARSKVGSVQVNR